MAQNRAAVEIWEGRVAAWQGSGLSMQRFAKREGLSYKTLTRWVHKIGVVPKRGRPFVTPPVPVTDLLPIEVCMTSKTMAVIAPIELRLRGGRVIVVPGPFNDELLARLITVVERAA